MENFLKNQHIFWLFVSGLGLVCFGIYWGYTTQQAMDTGESVRMPKALRVLYDKIGVIGIVVFYELLGILLCIQGINTLRKRK